MESIIFQLHPDWLNNPDADLRYLIPEELEKLSTNTLKIADDGYEYDDEDEYMFIFISTTDSLAFLKTAKDYLAKHNILDNNILNSCIIAKKKGPDNYEILHKFNDEVKFKKPPQLATQ